MARTKKNYGGIDYIADKDFDYTTAIAEAAAHGDYEYAKSLEKSRNAKIDGEGLSYAKTYKYQNGTPVKYESKNSGKVDSILSGILNRKPFSYDYTKDASYKALEKAYKANGKFAMQDTLGDAAALTGGKASTAAVSAAQQAYDRYMAGLSENIPALEQAAYGRYRDEEDSAYRAADALMAIDERDYGRWQDSRNRDYTVERDAVYDKRHENEWNYGVERDKIADARDEKEWNYGVERDKLADERYDDKLEYERDMDTVGRLMKIAQTTGDYSVLHSNPEIADRYGFSQDVVDALNAAYARGVSDKEIAEAFTRAEYMAQYGDFSAFRDAGFTDEQIAAMQKYWEDGKLREEALFAAQVGDYSGFSALGIKPAVSTGNSSGGSASYRSGTSSGTKPTLTAAQAKAALEDGIINESTVAAFNTYYGTTYSVEEAEKEFAGNAKKLGDALSGIADGAVGVLGKIGNPFAFKPGPAAASGDVTEVCDNMVDANASAGEIKSALSDAKAAGLISDIEYYTLYAKYKSMIKKRDGE